MQTMLTALITFCSLVSVGIVHGQSREQERNRQRNSNYVRLKRNFRKTGPLVLAIYIAMLASQLGHGLASLDGHAIVKVTRQLVDQQRLEVSRPPGHPTTGQPGSCSNPCW